MFHGYQDCIFCPNPLPDKPTGVGEHVFPESVYGFWRSYDICNECMKYFGKNIDPLAIQNPSILNAMAELQLPKHKAYYEQIKYKGTDTLSGEKIGMLFRNGDFKTKAFEEGNGNFCCAEKDWEKMCRKWLTQENPSPESVLQVEIERLKSNYQSLRPGEHTLSGRLGIGIRKRSVTKVEIDEESLKPITPLISKIAVIALCYLFPKEELLSSSNIEGFIKHARYLTELPEPKINWCPLNQVRNYRKFHRVRFTFFDEAMLVDVTFFGYPNWRTLLHCSQSMRKNDPSGEPVKAIDFVLDFDDPKERKKYVGFLYTDQKPPIYGEIEE